MGARFGKHNIIGSEAGAPRPIAYLRGDRGFRRAGMLTRKGLWLLAFTAAAAAAVALTFGAGDLA